MGALQFFGVILCELLQATGFGAPQVAADQVGSSAQLQSLVGKGARPVSIAKTNAASDSQPIIITGSRLPRERLDAVSPVTMISAQSYKLEGAVLTEDLINQLPQVTPQQGAFISNNATGAATVDLRNLGASRTLILVNGRRLLPGDPTDPAADINIVPSSLIQRVDLLTGGASSVYGSDAVSGVVNFILDTKFEGVRIDAETSLYEHDRSAGAAIEQALSDDGITPPRGSLVNTANQDVNAAIGTGFLDGRGHVTLYGGYRHLSAITQAERDYSACNLNADPSDPYNPDQIFCGGSSVSATGNFLTYFNVFHLDPSQTFTSGPTYFNYAPDNYYQRPARRYTAGGFFNLELTRALKPYLETMYMDDRTVAQIASSGDFFSTGTVNCDNPLLSAQQRSTVCFNGNYVGQIPIFDENGNLISISGSPQVFTDPVTGSQYYEGNLLIGRRNIEGGPRRDDRRHRDLRLVLGTTGDLAEGVSYDASYSASSVKFSDAFSNDVSITRLNRALDVVTDPATGNPVCRSKLTGVDPACVPWDVFVLGGVTPQAAAYISLPASQSASIRQQVASVNATIELKQLGIKSPWSDEGPALNLGAEYRKDSLDFRPDAAFQSGDLAGESQAIIPFQGSTSVREMFGEARVPLVTGGLVENIAVEGGYRRSWHADGVSRFSTSSSKLALDFTPVTGLRIRASLQHAVRAPNIQELFAPTYVSGFSNDPCAGIAPTATAQQCARTGVSAAQYGQILANPLGANGGYNSVEGGNPSLGPEASNTKTAGVVLEPRILPGFSATADWFDITIKEAIEVVGAQAIMDTCVATGDPRFCSRIHRDASGSLWETPEGFVDDSNANIGALKVRGIDLSANYARDVGDIGSTKLEFLGSRLLKYVVNNGGLSTPYECTGLYGYPCDVPLPKWRHTARLTWSFRGGPSLSLNWRYIGNVGLAALNPQFGLLDQVSPLETRIRAQNYFDLTALVDVRHRYVFRLGVRNIFDKLPPIVTSRNPACGQTSTGFCNGNTYPQLYDPLGRYMFASMTITFKPHF